MQSKFSLISSFSLVILIILCAGIVNFSIPKPVMEEQDIYFSYVEGQRLKNGENPYARILQGDMRQNQKYATYFPEFYELSYLSQMLGLQSFTDWIAFWRIVFMIFEFVIAIFLYVVLARRNLEWAGVFAAAFWLFNRWTLSVVQIGNLDFIPIFFLLVSLELFSWKKIPALFLLSLSLGFKQIGVFLVPLYLIWVFRSAGKDWLKQVLKSSTVIASVPAISSIPFLIWDAKAFIKSVLFSVTRLTGNYSGPFSLDVLMKWEGIPARIVMFMLMLMIYVIVLKGNEKRYFPAFLVMAVFVGFNTVVFAQYIAWIVPLFLLIFCDLVDSTTPLESA